MPNEVIAFPDAEAVAISYLNELLPDTTVTTEVPGNRPARMVRVTRAGGRRRDLIADGAVLIFECWDTTSVDAYDLCRTVRAYVDAMAGTEVNGSWVYRVSEVGGPVYFPDPTTDYPRYQFTVQMDLRGGAL